MSHRSPEPNSTDLKCNRAIAFARVHELFRSRHGGYAIASRATAVFAALLLTGCGIGLRPLEPDELPVSAACCIPYSEMKYARLNVNTEATAELRAGTPVHQFQHGRSYYSAFALPPHTGPMKLAFETTVRGVWLPNATALRPYFVFLDEAKSVVSVVPDPPVSLETSSVGSFFKGEFDVPPNAAYVIVHTSTRPVPQWTVYSTFGKEWPVKPSMTGSLRIVVTSR